MAAGAGLLKALLLLLVPPCIRAVIDTTPLGCFFHGYKISEALQGLKNPVDARSAVECQQTCADTAGCQTFGFQPDHQDCWLGGALETPQKTVSPSFIAGPARCSVSGTFESGMPASASCTASPSTSFPGATPEQSAADFTTGLVPVSLQCWPYDEEGSLVPCKGEPIVTLEDTSTGWPGKCLGLHLVTLTAGESCEMSCRSNVSCSSWQHVESSGQLQCWQGTGYDCFGSRQVNVVRAQRFLRGHYRVLKDLKGYEVTGLRYAFGSGSFGPNVSAAVTACNHTCLSSLQCSAWRYSTGDGCWFDDPSGGSMAYPPTSETMSSTTEAAALVVAGQYIQRLCTVAQDIALETSTAIPTVALPSVEPLPAVSVETNETLVPATVAAPDVATETAGVAAPGAAAPAVAAPAVTTPAAAVAEVAAPAAAVPAAAVAPAGAVAEAGAPPAPAAPDIAQRSSPTDTQDATAAATSSFVKEVSTGAVYFKDSGADSLHLVRAGCDNWSCKDTSSTLCTDAILVDQAFVDKRAEGQDFVCEMLLEGPAAKQLPPGFGAEDAQLESPGINWWGWIIGLSVTILLCVCCNYVLFYNYVPIVKRYPWLDGYLPFQWGFGARNSFAKLQEGFGGVGSGERITRGVDLSYDSEDQFPLMYPGAGPGFPNQVAPSMPQMNQMPVPGPMQGFGPMAPSPGYMGYAGPMPPVDQGYDLVTVTPQGLQVTPLGDGALPQGVPVVSPGNLQYR